MKLKLSPPTFEIRKQAIEQGVRKQKPLAVIHIDVDSLWAIEEDFGNAAGCFDPSIYTHAIPRFMEMLKKYQIPATFFCTGRDALQNEQAAILRELVAQGHEIANHTMNHRQEFGQLDFADKRYEIIESDAILREATKTEILGFRAPGYFLDEFSIQILREIGYLYDSSRLPSPILPLFGALRYFLSGGLRTRKRFGQFTDLWANQNPYLLTRDRDDKGPSGDLLELPVSVIPILRFPFHSTMVFTLGRWLFDLGLRKMLQQAVPMVYLFHAVDLLPDTNNATAAKHPTLQVKFEQRLQLVEYMLNSINVSFEIVTTRAFAEHYKSTCFAQSRSNT